ncbi:hypothetical protein R1flu_017589 [Riccia fluitans]|uniref:Uncharacterized protein n=1 Tax=Riccia fluitans TaxID=41844 RepID=A0ABD1ZFS5_9MARC
MDPAPWEPYQIQALNESFEVDLKCHREHNPDAKYSSLVICINPTHYTSKADSRDDFPLSWKADIIWGTHSLVAKYRLTCKKPGCFNQLMYVKYVVYVGLTKSEVALIAHDDNADLQITLKCKAIKNHDVMAVCFYQQVGVPNLEEVVNLFLDYAMEQQMGQFEDIFKILMKDRSKRATLAKYTHIKVDDEENAPGKKKNRKRESGHRKTLLEVLLERFISYCQFAKKYRQRLEQGVETL